MKKMDAVKTVESFVLSIPRAEPYLGPLGDGESINARGYLIRKGNKSIYPSTDMSVLVKVTTEGGRVGWGECYAIAAPDAIKSIIDDLLGPVIIGRDPMDVAVIFEDLYNLMRVRGFITGYYVDALAGIDIALWDAAGKIANVPLAKLLGGCRYPKIPAYVSGLPRKTLTERVDLAIEWVKKGYSAIKFASAVSHEGSAQEFAALREAVGPEVHLMIDMHWKYTAAEALSLINDIAPYRPYFVEAPCQPEDVEGLTEVARRSPAPVAAGEEWRTVYECRSRLEARAASILQPEMGHTGITQFMRIGQMAQAFHCRLIPHASIGIGIFQAASLHATAALEHVPYHEYQHSIFDKNLRFVTGDMACEKGAFSVPTGAGLGAEPSEAVWEFVRTRD